MEINQVALIPFLLHSLLLGIFFGAVYDILRIRRLAFDPEIRLELRKRRGGKEAPRKGVESSEVGDVRGSGESSDSAGGADAGSKSAAKKFFLQNIKVIDTCLIFFEDIAYSVFCAVCMVLLTYMDNSGIVRGFSVFAAVLGFIAYRFTLGRVVKACAVTIIGFLRFIFAFAIRYTLRPAARLFSRIFSSVSDAMSRRAILRYTKKRKKKFMELGSRL